MGKRLGLWFGLLVLTAVAAGGFSYLSSRENHEELFANLTARGVSYEQVTQDSAGVLAFVAPKLDIGLAEPIALGSLSAIKAQTGYDLSFEQLEITFANGDLKLTFPQVEIKDWQAAGKIEATANGLSTAGYLAPFFHDKAASIRLAGTHLKGDFTFVSAAVFVDYTIGEIMMEGVDSGKIALYHDKDTALALNIDPDPINVDSEAMQQMLKMEGDIIAVTLARNQLQDLNLARLMEFVFLDSDNPDGPFEQIYGNAEMEGYQLNQFNGMATTKYNKITASPTKMRGAKKAPFTVFQEFFALVELSEKEMAKPDDVRIFAVMSDIFGLIKMIGELKNSIEGISQTQNYPEIGQVKMDIARVDMHMKETSFDGSYHDMAITSDAVDISIGAIEVKDFAHIRLIEGLENMVKTILKQGNEENDRTFKEKNDELTQVGLMILPHVGKFSMEDFYLVGSDKFPFKDMVGEWSFERIAFTNGYEFDEAVFPTSFSFEIEDLAMPAYLVTELSDVDPQVNDAFFCALGEEKFLTSSVTLKSEWDRQTQSLTFPNNFYEDNVTGKVGLEMQLGNMSEKFFSLNPKPNEEDAQKLSLKTLKLSYDPQKHDAAFLDCMGEKSGVSAQALRSWVVMGLRMAVPPNEEIEHHIKPLRESLIKFVKDGGKLELSVKAKKDAGVTFYSLDSRIAFVNPFDLFDVELKHEP